MPRLPQSLRSEHPLGQAIVSYARAKGRTISEPEHFDYTPGRGIAAVVDRAQVLVGNRALDDRAHESAADNPDWQIEAASEIFVARDGQFLGQIVVADTVRPRPNGRRGARAECACAPFC